MKSAKRAMVLGALFGLVVTVAVGRTAAQQQPQPRPVINIQGVWNHTDLMTEERATLINNVGGGAKIGDYTGFPLNDAGRQWADSWMMARMEMPEHQCHPHPAQYSLWGPGHFRITNILEPQTDRIIGLRLSGTFGRADRTIWLDGRPEPPPYARHTWSGFASGQWDGNMLTVDISHLKEGWLSRNGIMVSDHATMREHYIRHDNYLTVIFVVNDPEHLDEPFIRTTQAVYDPTVQLGPQECQPFNTNVINPNHGRDYVPHWLPGKNPGLGEFPAKYGVPPEAARGMQKTLYPEYIAEIKTWMETRKPTAASSK